MCSTNCDIVQCSKDTGTKCRRNYYRVCFIHSSHSSYARWDATFVFSNKPPGSKCKKQHRLYISGTISVLIRVFSNSSFWFFVSYRCTFFIFWWKQHVWLNSKFLILNVPKIKDVILTHNTTRWSIIDSKLYLFENFSIWKLEFQVSKFPVPIGLLLKRYYILMINF